MDYKNNFFKGIVCSVLAAVLLFSFTSKPSSPDPVRISAFGDQPALTVDNSNLHVVLGQGRKIFYTFSKDNGSTFSTPQKAGKQDELALGVSRGNFLRF